MKRFIKKRILTSPKQVREICKLAKDLELTIFTVGIGGEYNSKEQAKRDPKYKSLKHSIIFEVKESKLEITTYWYGTEGNCTWIFDLNGEDTFSVTGLSCFAQMSKCYKVKKANEYPEENRPRLDEETGKYISSASPVVDYNPEHEKQELFDCYEYDLNSAYTSIILKGIPDLDNPKFAKYPEYIEVKKGEVGFLYREDMNCTMVHPGDYADVTFKIIPTPQPLIDFCNKYYTKKKTTTGNEKLNAKAMLNLPIGYTQRVNPFFRAYIVHSCNEVIKALIDENTLFWNTDAIFSKVRRTDLKIGKEIGEFKEVHADKIRYIGNNYQIDDDIPTYRGICKNWFRNFEKINGRKFDILKDTAPYILNKYKFDLKELKLTEVNYGKEISK